jgi:hypothetical protein
MLVLTILDHMARLPNCVRPRRHNGATPLAIAMGKMHHYRVDRLENSDRYIVPRVPISVYSENRRRAIGRRG